LDRHFNFNRERDYAALSAAFVRTLAAQHLTDAIMRTTLALLVLATLACRGTIHSSAPTIVLLRERFSEATFREWVVVAPNVAGATARLEDGAIVLTMPDNGNGDITVRRKLDVVPMRGKRIQLRSHVRTEGSAASSARATLTVATSSIVPTYRDTSSTSSIKSGSSSTIHAVIDIPPESISVQVDMALRGSGSAWFDDVEVSVIGAMPPVTPLELSLQQLASLVTFTRAATLIRYLHPSDQAASLDWNAFLPTAIEQILHASPHAELTSELRALFKDIAPTVTFSSTASPAALSIPARGESTQLVRWRRHGYGTSPPFSAYREGIDPENSSASAFTRLPREKLKVCKRISVRIAGRRLLGAGRASSFVRVLRPVTNQDEVSEPLRESGGDVVVAVELPADAGDVEVGLRIEGRSGATIDRLSVSCDGSPYQMLGIASSQWRYVDDTELYTWRISECDKNPCATLERDTSDDAFDPAHDLPSIDIGQGITMQLPLAVWRDVHGTLPSGTGRQSFKHFTIDDASLRLAAIAAAWGALSLFYPYFSDQGIDWLTALPDALREAATARSPRDTHIALNHLVARLQDNHGKVTHPGASMAGILPITFRRFGDKVLVIGGVSEYLKIIPLGSELLEIDGIPALQAYDDVAKQVSAATEGLREYLTPARMEMGYPGAFIPLKVRGRDGRVVDHALAFVNDDLYSHSNREPRPASGAELAPGIYYLDLDSLPAATWGRVLPILQHAKAIILDFRGYVNGTTLEVMSHLTTHELRSPIWQTPLVPNVRGQKYNTGYWYIRPQVPRLTAKIVALIDARAMSAVETVLQMFRENRLGILVGETSGGTNGNVAYIETPGGFKIRFTAMRASSEDGSTIHGHGIKPDYIVHPSLDGVQAGRDEILEAGTGIAKRVIGP
jgi:Peptidase family S41